MTTMIGSVDSPTPEWAKWIDKRKHLQELQKDPDWMLQAGLGDVEFEQDLYDAFKYSPLGENKLSLKALRDFGEKSKGAGRYIDETPYTEEIFGDMFELPDEILEMMNDPSEMPTLEDILDPDYEKSQSSLEAAMKGWESNLNRELTEIAEYMDVDPSTLTDPFSVYENEDLADLGALGYYTGKKPYGERYIDISLKGIEGALNHIKARDPRWRNPHANEADIEKGYSLRDFIFDIYGHELPHGMDFQRFPGKEKLRVLKEAPDPLEHPAIYRNQMIYGLSEPAKVMGEQRWNVPVPGPGWGKRITLDRVADAAAYPLEYFGRSPMDERRIWPQDTFYQDYPYAGANVAAGGAPPLHKQSIGPVGTNREITGRDDDYNIGKYGEF